MNTSAPDVSSCHACKLCLLVCPLWQQGRDITETPMGRIKAMQFSDNVDVIANDVFNCTLCGACDPVCPKEIPLTETILGQRRKAVAAGNHQQQIQAIQQKMNQALDNAIQKLPSQEKINGIDVLLPDQALQEKTDTLRKVVDLLDSNKLSIAEDTGQDIIRALEAGVDIPTKRIDSFIAPLQYAKRIIVGDGMLVKALRQWLPRNNIVGLGHMLSSHRNIRSELKSTDFYMIESRAYHHDFQKLVKHYDDLRHDSGCQINIDLQRMALPTGSMGSYQELAPQALDIESQVQWLLQGRDVERIVVENLSDAEAMSKGSDIAVVHIADIAS